MVPSLSERRQGRPCGQPPATRHLGQGMETSCHLAFIGKAALAPQNHQHPGRQAGMWELVATAVAGLNAGAGLQAALAGAPSAASDSIAFTRFASRSRMLSLLLSTVSTSSCLTAYYGGAWEGRSCRQPRLLAQGVSRQAGARPWRLPALPLLPNLGTTAAWPMASIHGIQPLNHFLCLINQVPRAPLVDPSNASQPQ